MYKCNILSVNMRRMNAAMHALLSTNEEDDLLCVQEPWFNKIGVRRDDKEQKGMDVSGGAAHPDFTLVYPYYTNNRIMNVTIRARTSRAAYSPVMTTVLRNCHLVLVMDSRLSQRSSITCYDLGSDFSARLLTGYDYGTPKASSRISHGQSYQSA